MMRKGIVIAGIIMLVIGFPLYSYGVAVLQEHQLHSTMDELYIFFQSLIGNAQLQTEIKIAYSLELIGGILCVIGIFTTVIGLAVKLKRKRKNHSHNFMEVKK
jgi:uncharacterized membrane protein